MDESGGEENDEEREDAALGTGGAAGDPFGAGGSGVEKMADAEEAAVGSAVKKGLSPVPRRVEADAEPEAAGAANDQAENHADDEDLENAEKVFTAIAKMGRGEQQRHNQSGRPEGETAGEREQEVAAKETFLVDTHAEKSHAPGERVFEDGGVRQGETGDAEIAADMQDEKKGGKHDESPQDAFPEEEAQSLAGREADFIEGFARDTRGKEGGEENGNSESAFDGKNGGESEIFNFQLKVKKNVEEMKDERRESGGNENKNQNADQNPGIKFFWRGRWGERSACRRGGGSAEGR